MQNQFNFHGCEPDSIVRKLKETRKPWRNIKVKEIKDYCVVIIERKAFIYLIFEHYTALLVYRFAIHCDNTVL